MLIHLDTQYLAGNSTPLGPLFSITNINVLAQLQVFLRNPPTN